LAKEWNSHERPDSLLEGAGFEPDFLSPDPIDRRADKRIIERGGRTLMPSLIDARAQCDGQHHVDRLSENL
jgi:hypothetical protein